MRRFEEMDIAVKMAAILCSCLAGLLALVLIQNRNKLGESSMWPHPLYEPSKRDYECFVCFYTPVWIGAFGIIVAFQLYEDFTPITYILVCGGLATPFLLQPIVYPMSFDAERPFYARYSFKANLWIAIYSFIGNYWYTHYFYSVLKAAYTMPNAIRLNNVPIAMFLATHFYFSTYHWFSNCLLRYIVTTFQRTLQRDVLFVATVGVFSYFTAFMETFTISAYPYWAFQDRNMTYTVGSAFYGIYFIVSFPAFFFFDKAIDQGKGISVWDTIVSSCGYGMMILLLLDFVRLYIGIPLIVGSAKGL